MNTGDLKKRKEVKTTESPIEEKLLLWFKEYGLFPELQYEIPPYRADFAFPDKKIIVECDGREFHTSDEDRERDAIRDKYLQSKGWEVIRFTGSEIYRESWSCVKRIMEIWYPKKHEPTDYEKYWKANELKNEAWREAQDFALLERAKESKIS